MSVKSDIIDSLVNEDMASLYGKFSNSLISNAISKSVDDALQSLSNGKIKGIPIKFQNKDADMGDVLGLSGTKVSFSDKNTIPMYNGHNNRKYFIKDKILMILFPFNRDSTCSGLKLVYSVVCFEFKNSKDIKGFIQYAINYSNFTTVGDIDKYISNTYGAKYKCSYMLHKGTLLTAREWIESLQPIKNVAKFLQTEDRGIDYKKELKSISIEESSIGCSYGCDLEFHVILDFKSSASASTFYETLKNGDAISNYLMSISDVMYSDKNSVCVVGTKVVFRY